ncbi:SDR family NAD(P)-dependent oxidoreductase [Promicromonospora sp. NPDC023805]|uniref:SDR family NAD(P)-dependent oxidoreductase n=1 Tax=Promicromonospora sp. NPDC023805 TaxID=3154696 RepID=UPI0033F77A10
MTRALALITGASSGIGLAYARTLAAEHDFVLVARREDRLVALAEELATVGAATELLPVDLSTRSGVAAVVERLSAGDVRLLISNAGAAGEGRVAETDQAAIDPFMTLNALATIELARAALPGMLAADDGTIITVSSLLAFSAGVSEEHIPARTLYATAKAAIVAFTRGLAIEVADTGVRAQLVVPGSTATEFGGGRRTPRPTAMSADGVVQASLTGLRLGESICIPGLEDQAAALDALASAEATLMFGGNKPTPAVRYLVTAES